MHSGALCIVSQFLPCFCVLFRATNEPIDLFDFLHFVVIIASYCNIVIYLRIFFCQCWHYLKEFVNLNQSDQVQLHGMCAAYAQNWSCHLAEQ